MTKLKSIFQVESDGSQGEKLVFLFSITPSCCWILQPLLLPEASGCDKNKRMVTHAQVLSLCAAALGWAGRHPAWKSAALFYTVHHLVLAFPSGFLY